MISLIFRGASVSICLAVFSLSAVQTNAQIQQGEIKMAQADNAKAMADIQLALKKIDKGLQTHRVPKPIFPPFEDGQIESWIEAVSYTLSDGLTGYEQEMQYYKGASASENFARLRAYGEAALAIEEGLGNDGARPKAFLKKLAGYEAKLAGAEAAALESFKLPKPKSKDKKRLKAAKAILETKKYGFGKYGPIVLTTEDIVSRERKDKEINVEDVDVSIHGDVKWSGTETVWTYKWDEFKFVTPIKDKGSDDWYMWTITAKKFSSGGERTPIGKWVSGKAYKGSPILKKNF